MSMLNVRGPDGKFHPLEVIVGPPGPAGPQGPAYTLTEEDKDTIAAAVKSALPTLTVTGIDADGVFHSWTVYGVAK